MAFGKIFLRDAAGSPERARWLHLARSGSQSQRRIRFILPAHGASRIINKYTGPYNDLERQVKYDRDTGQIYEIYDPPTGKTDAIAMQHDVDYSVCGDDKACKHVADRKMVNALDAVPWGERQWGHWLARNSINTKQKLGLGTQKSKKKTPKFNVARRTSR